MRLRLEAPEDAPAIARVTRRAFDGHPHGDGSEPAIVARLRAADALVVSLVATTNGRVVGHAAFSRVGWPGDGLWAGLGPISVDPEVQNAGIGAFLIREGLDRLRALGFDGCVVMGEPAYYGRFGFQADERFTLADCPPGYFMRLAFGAIRGTGAVTYHSAFGLDPPERPR